MTTATGEKLLLELLDGFLASKVLMTAYKLDLFTAAREPIARDALRAALDLPERSFRIVVDACVALGLLHEDGRGLVTPAELAPFLVRAEGRPFQTTTYLLEYYDEVYRALSDMDGLVRSDGATSPFKLRDYFKDDVAAIDPQVAAEYSRYMDATIARIVEVVLATYPFGQHRRLLDLCGNTGSFCAAIVAATPGLTGAFLDVPACVDIGRRQLAARPELAGRVDAIAGDLFRTPLPSGFDVITMCRSAMDWGDAKMVEVYRRAREALPPDGRFLVIERMLPARVLPEALPMYLRGVYFLAKSESTRYRSPQEHLALLRAAGFSDITELEPPRAPYEFFQSMRILVAGP
ncbi:methyltransferase [Nannocystis radixulma]|uniref:Methyltransferase n=1 Tax=Nannocystis radixulma TaxID=2995305 RepID=A0ABT5B1V8_9BACT|nr:methyltransferase [Nannocystis radixulma]MDC0668090.1 methyltransferase [Nannocystis radixulma]